MFPTFMGLLLVRMICLVFIFSHCNFIFYFFAFHYSWFTMFCQFLLYSQVNNQIYKLLHSKGNHKKRQPMEWDKIVGNNATEKGLISKICKQLIQLNSKKKKKPQLKIGRRENSSKKTHRRLTGTWTNAQQHYQRNANQNYNEAPPHTGQNGYH